jgi:hypothetical protein
MFALPDVLHFFTHKFTCLSGRRFAFAFVFTSTFNSFFFWHNNIGSLITPYLDVRKRAQVKQSLRQQQPRLQGLGQG